MLYEAARMKLARDSDFRTFLSFLATYGFSTLVHKLSAAADPSAQSTFSSHLDGLLAAISASSFVLDHHAGLAW